MERRGKQPPFQDNRHSPIFVLPTAVMEMLLSWKRCRPRSVASHEKFTLAVYYATPESSRLIPRKKGIRQHVETTRVSVNNHGSTARNQTTSRRWLSDYCVLSVYCVLLSLHPLLLVRVCDPGSRKNVGYILREGSNNINQHKT